MGAIQYLYQQGEAVSYEPQALYDQDHNGGKLNEGLLAVKNEFQTAGIIDEDRNVNDYSTQIQELSLPDEKLLQSLFALVDKLITTKFLLDDPDIVDNNLQEAGLNLSGLLDLTLTIVDDVYKKASAESKAFAQQVMAAFMIREDRIAAIYKEREEDFTEFFEALQITKDRKLDRPSS